MTNFMSDEEIEEKLGLSPERVAELAAPYERDELPANGFGPIRMGRPQKFGIPLKTIAFKIGDPAIKEMDKRALELGVSRSDYLRALVHQDLLRSEFQQPNEDIIGLEAS